MRLFTVLEPPAGNPDRVVFVREGFSLGALLFTMFWALWHRMVVVAALLFASTAALTVASNLGLLGPGFTALLQFGIAVLFAFEARALQVKALERSGYRRSGLIQASNVEAAELAYFASRAPFSPESARMRNAHYDALGMFGNV